MSAKSKQMWNYQGDRLRQIYSSKEHKAKLSYSIRQYYLEHPEAKERISKKRSEMIWITNGIEVRQISKRYFPNFKGENNWNRGKVFIPFDDLALMLGDYFEPNDLSLGELSKKYGYSRGVIQSAFVQCNVPIKNKAYKTQSANKGLKRSEETRKKLSKSTSKYRTGRVFVYKNEVTKSILKNEVDFYLKNGWLLGRGHINSENMKKPDSMKKKIIRSDGMIFDSICDATKQTGLSKSAILNVLKKRPHSKTAGGYGWNYYTGNNEN